MTKYVVYGVASATIIVGEYDASSQEDAIKAAEQDRNADTHIGLCHQCSHRVDVGDVYEFQAEEAEDY